MADNTATTFRLGTTRRERIKDVVQRYEYSSACSFVKAAIDAALARLANDDILPPR